MGNPQRIPVDAIQAMKKILDALPDKNLDKTKEEALAMLSGQIQRAYSKGYSVKELAVIMAQGNVAVSAPTLRAHTCPSSPRARKAQPEAAAPEKAAPPQTETVKPETQKATPARKAEQKNMPSYYTPDRPDTEL
jgi:alkylhydroperoxidase/carboxymuconolactone decarboxylase family protein YurZ